MTPASLKKWTLATVLVTASAFGLAHAKTTAPAHHQASTTSSARAAHPAQHSRHPVKASRHAKALHHGHHPVSAKAASAKTGGAHKVKSHHKATKVQARQQRHAVH
jgi:hypothetical protein